MIFPYRKQDRVADQELLFSRYPIMQISFLSHTIPAREPKVLLDLSIV